MIHNLFPTPIGFYKLGRNLSSKELTFFKTLETRPNLVNLTSVDDNVLQNIKATQIRDFIETCVSGYFETVHNSRSKVNLKITQSWVNYTEQGRHHHRHTHPNSFLSGVFYIQANSDRDKIHFFKNTYQQIKFIPQEWNLWNSDSWWFEVEAGDLILFPSSLEHMVQTVTHPETRISLSFNTFPVGYVGDQTELTGLEITKLSSKPKNVKTN